MIVYVIVMHLTLATQVSYEHLGRFATRWHCEAARRAYDVDAAQRGVLFGPTTCEAVIR